MHRQEEQRSLRQQKLSPTTEIMAIDFVPQGNFNSAMVLDETGISSTVTSCPIERQLLKSLTTATITRGDANQRRLVQSLAASGIVHNPCSPSVNATITGTCARDGAADCKLGCPAHQNDNNQSLTRTSSCSRIVQPTNSSTFIDIDSDVDHSGDGVTMNLNLNFNPVSLPSDSRDIILMS